MNSLLFQLASVPALPGDGVEPSGVPPSDLVPYFTALRQLCCSDEEFQAMIASFDDPVIMIDNEKFLSRSVLSILSKYKRERSLWEDII